MLAKWLQENKLCGPVVSPLLFALTLWPMAALFTTKKASETQWARECRKSTCRVQSVQSFRWTQTSTKGKAQSGQSSAMTPMMIRVDGRCRANFAIHFLFLESSSSFQRVTVDDWLPLIANWIITPSEAHRYWASLCSSNCAQPSLHLILSNVTLLRRRFLTTSYVFLSFCCWYTVNPTDYIEVVVGQLFPFFSFLLIYLTFLSLVDHRQIWRFCCHLFSAFYLSFAFAHANGTQWLKKSSLVFTSLLMGFLFFFCAHLSFTSIYQHHLYIEWCWLMVCSPFLWQTTSATVVVCVCLQDDTVQVDHFRSWLAHSDITMLTMRAAKLVSQVITRMYHTFHSNAYLYGPLFATALSLSQQLIFS